MNADSAVPGLNRETAHPRQILVPSYEVQRAIAHILGSLDDKIELNRRMNQILEAIASAGFPEDHRYLRAFGGLRKSAPLTQEFFATVQNKLHWAITGITAAEIIYDSADARKMHMGLTSWKEAPDGKILKSDVSIAQNYLSEAHIRELNRNVTAYLDLAER